jgi:F-type H+-transporting ATPase subunit delta
MQEPTKQIATVFDSEQQHIGEVYAKALLSAAKNGSKIDRVADEFESLVSDVFKAQPAFEMVLSNPKMPVEDKSLLLDRVFGKSMDPTLLTFLKVLCRRQRMNSVRSIQKAVTELRDEIAGVIRVTATVSSPLNAASEAALVAKLKTTFNKEVRLVTVVDPSILGGLIVRVGDTVFDASVDGQLQLLRKSAGFKAESAVREKSTSLVTST